ncbi:probable phytol kinase 2, chloroplastic isoform X3 [Cryptomeria japonica]|uniref:probable phytol kinase 2, chloroplastic isoform X3 n=2 Tax=Cryptomeria japonica TaxID=3369 RepID=UPI0025AD31E9|nr:probable phytol kinase 2, chloroplastic isoform X3 [Cryptomeria japonica]
MKWPNEMFLISKGHRMSSTLVRPEHYSKQNVNWDCLFSISLFKRTKTNLGVHRGYRVKKLNRKFVHINIGLVFMLCWPLFSNGPQAPYLAALAPGVNIFRMIGLGFGILKNEAMVKSMSRYGDARELLKGPLYYACSLTFITILFWRTSPTAPVAMATLCAGDGVADIAGRRLGTIKLPYNRNKSFAGSFAMLIMGFTVSVGYLFYFASFGYYEVSLQMIMLTLFISIAATIIESLPISTDIDDNLTVSLISALVGFLVF